MARISFIINTFNRPVEVLEACIRSVQSQIPHDGSIVVVDQNQLPVVSPESGIVVTHHPTKSISAARNHAASLSTADWYVFLDDDGTLKSGSVAHLVNLLADGGPWDVIAGKVEVAGTGRTYSIRQNIAEGELSFMMHNAVMGGIVAVRGEVFRELGGFDERFGIGSMWGSGEESDFVVRAFFRKKRIYFLPSFCLYHPDAAEMDDDKVKSYAVGKGALLRNHVSMGWRLALVIEAVDALLLPLAEAIVYAGLCDGTKVRRALLKFRYRIKGYRLFGSCTEASAGGRTLAP